MRDGFVFSLQKQKLWLYHKCIPMWQSTLMPMPLPLWQHPLQRDEPPTLRPHCLPFPLCTCLASVATWFVPQTLYLGSPSFHLSICLPLTSASPGHQVFKQPLTHFSPSTITANLAPPRVRSPLKGLSKGGSSSSGPLSEDHLLLHYWNNSVGFAELAPPTSSSCVLEAWPISLKYCLGTCFLVQICQ